MRLTKNDLQHEFHYLSLWKFFKFHFTNLNYKMSTKLTCMPKEPVADNIFHFKNSNISVVH